MTQGCGFRIHDFEAAVPESRNSKADAFDLANLENDTERKYREVQGDSQELRVKRRELGRCHRFGERGRKQSERKKESNIRV